MLDPTVLAGEIADLKARGYMKEDGRLLISGRAHLIMPYHKKLDALRESEKKRKTGTTGRGIGPAYEDRAARTGIRVIDLLDKKNFREMVRENLKVKNFLIQRYYKDEPIKVLDVVREYSAYRDMFKKYVGQRAIPSQVHG